MIPNYDEKTGIHYGCISQNSVIQAWCDEAQAEYPKPVCTDCGTELVELTLEVPGTEELEGDLYCPSCIKGYDQDDVFPDDPMGYYIDDGEYKALDCLDSDILIILSPFYTYARLCSPCVPNAGDLGSPTDIDMGYKSYCFNHDWFEDGKAPYKVYNVLTNEEVLPQ
jgi:hypothetical protein